MLEQATKGLRGYYTNSVSTHFSLAQTCSKLNVLTLPVISCAIPAPGQVAAQMTLENRQSQTLFGVAFLFIVGHLLRVVLNLHELFTIDLIGQDEQQGDLPEYQDYDPNTIVDYDYYSDDCAHHWPFWSMVRVCLSVYWLPLCDCVLKVGEYQLA